MGDEELRELIEWQVGRRGFLKGALTSAALPKAGIAAAALGATGLAACTDGQEVTGAAGEFKARPGSKSGPIKMGILEDQSGNFALFGIPKVHGAELAVEEINNGFTCADMKGGLGVFAQGAPRPPTQTIEEVVDRGGQAEVQALVYREEDDYLVKSGDDGLLGREVEMLAPDPQSDNERFQSLGRRVVLDDEVDVVFAAFASAEREAIRPLMDELKQLYFYNNQYEGGVADKYTFCCGAVPEQQIIPVMQYMIANYGPNFYTLAADYNFGQLSAAWSRGLAPILGGKLVNEEFIPLAVSQFSDVISRVSRAEPDWLLMYITGENHSNYYPQANSAGVRIPMGSSINIAQGYEHLRFDPPALSGMHVTTNWMEEYQTSRARKFVERWRKKFPDEPDIAQEAQTEYLAVHLWAKAVRLAGTTDQTEVIRALESGMGMEAPEGTVFMDPATHHLTHPIALAQADDEHNITFVRFWETIEPWWTRRLGVNLVRNLEFKQYTPQEDPYFKEAEEKAEA